MNLHDINMQIAGELRAINADSGGFVAGILSDDLPEEEQIAFAHRLVDVAELIRQRATNTPLVIEGGIINDSAGGTSNATGHGELPA